MGYEVIMNGTTRYARFNTRAEAEAYVRMQKCKIKGAGVGASPAESGRQAFAALQRWSIRATESRVA